MSTEDERQTRREGSPEWHRARANNLREYGFTKIAEEHEQIAREIEQRRGKAAGEIALLRSGRLPIWNASSRAGKNA